MIYFPKPSKEYSYERNPYILEFIKFHYNLDSNPVDKPPEKKTFQGVKKTGPIYAMHRYWTKQPIDIIKQYIEYFCPPKGIVLDPFSGTGTTGVASLLSNRPVILCDLSKIATFISKNYTEKTNIMEIDNTIKKIHKKLFPILDHFYSTSCSSCNSKAEIKDWIYSEKLKCNTCDSILEFIEYGSTWEIIQAKKHTSKVFCINCNQEKDKSLLNFQSFFPLGLRFKCSPCKLRKHFKLLDEQDKKKLDSKELNNIYKITPFTILPEGVNTGQAKIKLIENTNEFFTPITLFILSNLWKEINVIKNLETKAKLQFIFSSILFRVTRLYRLRVNGQGGILSGTLYVPSLSQDINVWDVFIERYRKISKGWKSLNLGLTMQYNKNRIISTQSATNLSNIPTESIDYIYTDPPYGGNINYSELNIIWESWFGITTDIDKEIIINEAGQQKTLKDYENLLQQSINELFRVLKKGHWCTLVFNSSTPKLWTSIQQVIEKSGFFIHKDISMIESNMTTAKQTQSKKSARRYLLMQLQKPHESEQSKTNISKLSNEITNEILIYEISQFLVGVENNCASYDQIYDSLISNLLSRKKLKDFDLPLLLKENFIHKGNDTWSLLN